MKLIQYFALPIAFLFLMETAAAQVGITPEQAPQIAEFAVTQVKQFDGYLLDYSPESLKIIDRIVLKLHDEGNSPQSMPKTVTILGCYVGEVMVRNLGYKWDLPTEKEKAVGFEIVGIRDKKGGFSNPIGKIYKRLQNGNEDSVMQFYQVFSTSIAESVEKSKLTK